MVLLLLLLLLLSLSLLFMPSKSIASAFILLVFVGSAIMLLGLLYIEESALMLKLESFELHTVSHRKGVQQRLPNC